MIVKTINNHVSKIIATNNLLRLRVIFLILFLVTSLSLITTQVFASNQKNIIKLAKPEFSHESGFYPEEFELTLSHPDPAATIYYTLDASDPDPENLDGKTFKYKNNYSYPPSKDDFLELDYKTYKYSEPISIQNITPQENLIANFRTSFPDNLKITNSVKNKLIYIPNKAIHLANKIASNFNDNQFPFNQIKLDITEVLTTEDINTPPLIKGKIVKAISVLGHSRSRTESKVFFIKEKVNLPVVNITIPYKYLFDYESGIFTPGIHYDSYLKSPNIHTGMTSNHKPANWKNITDKKDAYLSFITPSFINNSAVKIKINGNGSRSYEMKSLRIYPDKKIKYELFRDQEVQEGRLILRNGGDSRWDSYLADAAIQQSFKGLNFLTQRYTPMNTFINGEYYGISNLRDRLDKNTIAERTGLNNKNISIHKNKVLFPKEMHFKQKDIQEIKGAKDSLHDNFISLLENKTLSANSFKELASISSFIDYYAAEIFIANDDWIKNNLAYWRYTGSIDPNNKFSDGKYRWLMFDIDAVGGNRKSKKNFQHPTLDRANNDKYYQQSLPFIAFLKNPELKLQFITRFSDLLNSWFVPERMIKIIRDAELAIEEEMPRHIERWEAPKSIEHWKYSIDNLVEFFEQRPKYQWQHLQEFFSLEDTYKVQIDISEQNTGKIKLNTLTLGDDPSINYAITDTPLFFPWAGKYFQKLPLTLEAIPEEGFEFSHWEAPLPVELKNKSKIVLHPEKNIQIKAVFNKK